jgi:hypothetical protein
MGLYTQLPGELDQVDVIIAGGMYPFSGWGMGYNY